MSVQQKNPEDFQIMESLNGNNRTFLCVNKQTGDKLVMKRLQFTNKNSRIEGIKQM